MNPLDQLPEDLISKIQKLINLKEGAEAIGSLAEAENAATRLQQLLMKHNLDLETVRAHQINKKAEMFDQWVDLRDKADKRESFWVPKLYGAIARNNLCFVNVSEHGVWIVGEKHNAAMVMYIAEQLIAKIRIIEKSAWKIYEAAPLERAWGQKEKRGTWRRGFYAGAAQGIDQKLKREAQEMQQENNPFAVMIVNRAKTVNDYLEEKYWKPAEERAEAMTDKERKKAERETRKLMKRKGPREISSNDGYRSGYDTGLKINIDKGLNQSQTKGNIQ